MKNSKIFIAMLASWCLLMVLPAYSQKQSSSQTKTVVKLPVTIQAYKTSYTIEAYKIKKDDKGNTIITLTGKGFGTLKIVNGETNVPIWCAFIAGGKEYSSTGANVGNASNDYNFDSSAVPETIILYPADDQSKRVMIKCK